MRELDKFPVVVFKNVDTLQTMKILAPILVIVAATALLYRTEEVWPKADYDASFVKKAGVAAVAEAGGMSGVRPTIDTSEYAPMAAGWGSGGGGSN